MCKKALQVSIIDYGMGNLFSIKKVCELVGLKPVITSQVNDIMSSDAVILPGVGAFGDAMGTLRSLDLIVPLCDFIASGRPFMGVCLGMQLLFSESEEFGRYEGLKIIPGSVLKFSMATLNGERVKIPQVCWNRIHRPVSKDENFWEASPFAGIQDGEFMYFVHSYYCKPQDSNAVLSITRYGSTDYCSSVFLRNVLGFQFHPEKSARQGIQIYRNWAKFINESR